MSGRSQELEAILRRWLMAMTAGDSRTVRNLLTTDPGAHYCGSSRHEFVTGRELQEGIEAHVGEIRNIDIEEADYCSQEFGDTGWAIAKTLLRHRQNGNRVCWRVSIFFRLEVGIWKAHQVHSSFATDEHKIMGVQHMAFQELLESARNLDPQIGRGGSATVMFTDIVGSSALTEAMGDGRWTKAVNAHIEAVTADINCEGGRMIKSLGDGTMSIFTSAGAGMRAAKAVQRRLEGRNDEPRLRVRIGLHTGDVIESGNDFFGAVVNKAARVASIAGPEEILVSDATRIMVGGARGFDFTDTAVIRLKGLEGEHVIHRLEWRAG